MGFERIIRRAVLNFEKMGLRPTIYRQASSILEGKSMKEVAKFVTTKLSPIEEVVNTSTFFVLKKYKEHGLLMVKEKNEQERMLITP